VFSPYYFMARAAGAGDPENFCSINIALYGTTRRWAMTERSRRTVSREELQIRVGPSQMKWEGDTLVITIDERGTPWPHAVRGVVKLRCDAFYNDPITLSEIGQHHWRVVAPRARIDAQFDAPRLSWSGHGYHDMNWGDAPLEDAFSAWTWQRSHRDDGAIVFYDAVLKDATRQQFGRAYVDGRIEHRLMPMQHSSKRGLWRMTRQVASELPPMFVMPLEDAPFYTRDHVKVVLDGARFDTIHESLSLKRFAHPIVQRMLPYRMLRVG
jgi:carotenoid 1,2-hydratase